MLDRFVMLKLVDAEATDAGRRAVVEEAKRVMPQVPGVEGVRLGCPADESAAGWDVAMVVTIRSADDLPAYRDDPAHRAFVDAFLGPRVAFKKAWNFERA